VSNLAALLALTGGAAFAQDWTEPVRHDLDQDGREEVYTLRNAGSGRVALVVGGPDGEAVYPGRTARARGRRAALPDGRRKRELLLTSVSDEASGSTVGR
jgi:hypothetical protein